MQPNVLDYASNQTPRRPIDWLRFAPFFAALCAAFAWIKSSLYHSYGQIRDEQMATLLFATLSVLCLIITFARFPRYRSDGWIKFVTVILLCAVILTLDALAVWNLSTATMGAKDRLF